MTHDLLSRTAAVLLLLVAAGSPTAAQDKAMSDRIAATIAAHEEGRPVAMWNPEDQSRTTTDAFRALLPSRLHRSLGPAWEAATEGKAPGTACHTLFMGMGARLENEATEAGDLAASMQGVDACHVPILTRYLSVKLAAGSPDGCIGEMVAITGHRNVADSLLRDADPEGHLLNYLDTRLRAVIGDLVRAAYPGNVTGILGSAS